MKGEGMNDDRLRTLLETIKESHGRFFVAPHDEIEWLLSKELAKRWGPSSLSGTAHGGPHTDFSNIKMEPQHAVCLTPKGEDKLAKLAEVAV